MTSEKPLTITFCVNTLGLTGGIKIIFEYANRLVERGHQVTIVHGLNLEKHDLPHGAGWRRLAKQLKFSGASLLGRPPVSWFDLSPAVTVRRVPRLVNRYLPDADVVIATANETADFVAQLAPAKGVKAYYIQHVEDWSRDPKLVAATWKLPLHKITIASWLAQHAKTLGEKVEAVITNGVDTDFYHANQVESLGSPDRVHQPVRLLLMGHPLAWKGVADAYEALTQLRENQPELAFTVTEFSAYPKTSLPYWQVERYHPALERTEFKEGVYGTAVRDLYQSHDILISPSHAEGCQLPPMEAMACGCAVVATNVGGIPDYAIAGKTALVVEPKQPGELAKQLADLVPDHGRIAQFQKAGHDHIQQFTWQRATDQFENTLRRIVKEERVGY